MARTASEETRITPLARLRDGALRIEEQTPTERDRFADLVRVVAILMVVLGHWLVAVVIVDDDRFVATQLLVLEPWTKWATWVWQVMPLFFIVGGRVNAGSLRRNRDRGDTTSMWVRRRTRRLLRPMVPLLLLWVVLGPVLDAIGLPVPIVERATEVAFMPLWFLVVYALIIVLAPLTSWLHRRVGWWVPAVATALVLAVDVLDLTDVPVVGEVNHLLVFGIAHQVGYLWADDRLPFGRRGLWVAAGGLLWAALLVAVFDYPVSMVGVEGPTRSNAAPPTLAMVALTAMQTGLLLALRGPCERWLDRAVMAWAAVVVTGSMIITIFLWHMSALVGVGALTYLVGWWPDVEPAGAAWWALRPVWVLLCVAALVPLVVVFRGAERVGEPRPGGPFVTVSGVLAAAGGLYLILEEGLYDVDRVLRVPVAAFALLFAGLLLLGALGRSPDDDTSD
ncbi:MAG: acyltransferase [Nitriliruptor sp.]|nr:MAG: acyltransferase [Nitriliruptor sp.]